MSLEHISRNPQTTLSHMLENSHAKKTDCVEVAGRRQECPDPEVPVAESGMQHDKDWEGVHLGRHTYTL